MAHYLKPRASPSASAGCWRSTRWILSWSRAGSSASSAPTAPARPPSSTPSPAFISPRRGRSSSTGTSLVGLRPDQITSLGMARTFQNIRLFGSHDRDRKHPGGHAPALAPDPMADAIIRTRKFHKEEEHAQTRAQELMALRGSRRAGQRAGAQPALRRSSAASRSPAPWLPSPSCCCWTSPPPA